MLSWFIRGVEVLCFHSDEQHDDFPTVFFYFFDIIVIKSLRVVNGWLAWGKVSMTSRPLLSNMCHSTTYVRNKADSPNNFCNIFNDSVTAISWKHKISIKLVVKFFFMEKSPDTLLWKFRKKIIYILVWNLKSVRIFPNPTCYFLLSLSLYEWKSRANEINSY